MNSIFQLLGKHILISGASNTKIYPKTKTKAVTDDSGTTLDTLLTGVNTDISDIQDDISDIQNDIDDLEKIAYNVTPERPESQSAVIVNDNLLAGKIYKYSDVDTMKIISGDYYSKQGPIVIIFKTASTIVDFSIAAGLDFMGDIPTFEAETKYILKIQYGIFDLQKIKTA